MSDFHANDKPETKDSGESQSENAKRSRQGFLPPTSQMCLYARSFPLKGLTFSQVVSNLVNKAIEKLNLSVC